MGAKIFHNETNVHEEWLVVNRDGSLTYHVENSGWAMRHNGVQAREKTYTADEAKKKWPNYANQIDLATSQKSS